MTSTPETTPTIATFPIPSSIDARNRIMTKIREISGHLDTIEGEKADIKKIIEDLEEEFEIPKKILNKFAKDYHNSTLAQSIGLNDEYENFVFALQPKAVGST
ncbi:MAG TPA: hypothetical protein VFM18_21345, partial [Methanosarcina sp.]|nr:hypothetical protein [Methanosarcina sp.]